MPWVSGTVTAECLDTAGNVVATDSRTTAGAESKIVLTVTPELTKPEGTNFQVTANGSDAAFVTATIEDANGNWEPLAADTLTFSVTGPATYQGGTQQYLSTNYRRLLQRQLYLCRRRARRFLSSLPGDPQLTVEGGMTRVALRSQFTPGTVTVTATAPGLASGSATFPIVAVPDPRSAANSCTAVPRRRQDCGNRQFRQRHQLELGGGEPADQLHHQSYNVYRQHHQRIYAFDE